MWLFSRVLSTATNHRSPGAGLTTRIFGVCASEDWAVSEDVRPGIATLPPTRHLVLLSVGTLAVGTSGPLIAATAVPALAIAFWRNMLGTLAVALPGLSRRGRQQLHQMERIEWLLALAAGLLLALHFGTWIPSLDYTSVASSIALVSTQPIWAALIARSLGYAVPHRVWVGIGVAFAGVLLLTGIDLQVSGRALAGDLLALAGGAFAAAYVTAGAVVRRRVSTSTYTAVCYATCAAALLLCCIAVGIPLGGYQADDWLKLLALTAGPQLLGHTVFNHVLKTTSATVVSMAILFEVPIAAILAAVWLGQAPPPAAIPAALLLLAGVATVVSADGSSSAILPDDALEPPGNGHRASPSE